MPPEAAAAISADVSPKRKLPWPELSVGLLLLIASAAPIAYDLYKMHHLMVPGAAMLGRDFVNCWVGANLAFHGPVSLVWSPDYMKAVRGLTRLPLGVHNFSYPPPLLLFIWPLALLSYVPALLVWLGATGAAFVAAARPYLARAKLPWWTAALIPAVLINMWAGHHGFVLAALWLAAFSGMEKRPVVAGVLIALLTLKPHMGILIPLVLLLRRQWTVIGVAAATTSLLVVLSGLLFGWQAWADYWTWTAQLQADMLLRADPLFFQFMPTAYVSVWLATGSFAAAVAAQLVLGLAAVAITVRASLGNMRWPELGLVTATATFLVLPYAFNYDMAVVGLAAAILLFGDGKRLTWYGRIAALLAFGMPILVIGANYERIPLLPFALLAFLWVQWRAYAPEQDKRPRGVLPRGLGVPA